MTHEIGGYLEMERNCGPMLHEELVALSSGRACLRYIIKAHDVHEMWLPDYMCKVIRETLEDTHVKALFYHVDVSFEPVWDFEVIDGQWFYLADYYGQLTDACVKRASEMSAGRLIVDETQGYFAEPRPGIDTIYTCRKYFGVPDGAFLNTDTHLGYEIPRDVSFTRMRQVLGRLECGSAGFLNDARLNNDELGEIGMRRMSILTENLLRGIDYEACRIARENNYSLLANELNAINKLCLHDVPGPFAYPLLVEDGPSVRGNLAKRGVFVPTLWPEVADEAPVDSVAKRYARDILPIPVDQRYSRADMEYVLECLHEEGVI